MTVSRVINGEASVLEQTREKVQAAIEALGYRPNSAARKLAGARNWRIALVYSNPSAGYLSELLLGSLAQARNSDVELLIEPMDGMDLVERLVAHRIDGVLLPAPLCDDPQLLEVLNKAGLEIVQIATGRANANAHAISIDDEAAAHTMTAYLLASGHTRIGFIEGDPSQTASALRRQGYERALREAGIACNETLIMRGDFSFQSGLPATERLLALAAPPTAIFASNDDMAAAAVSVGHRLGLAIPDDLSICGFDDTAIAQTLWPELTTIRQPAAMMARQATQILVDALHDRQSKIVHARKHVRLDFELIARGSTAAPKKSV